MATAADALEGVAWPWTRTFGIDLGVAFDLIIAQVSSLQYRYIDYSINILVIVYYIDYSIGILIMVGILIIVQVY